MPDTIKHEFGRIIRMTGARASRSGLNGAVASRAAVHGYCKGLSNFGRREDLARLTVFLASPNSDYITFTLMHVDGGYQRYAF